ncbi:MAG: LamG domain-containing protein [Acidobacteria bacterium]|nr:LamG domain-containing protein [Acidobacteriota bacterium]
MCRWFLPLLTTALFAANWKDDVLFRATFDGSVNAKTAAGDKTLYSAPTYKEPGKPGLEGSGVEHAKGAGRKGDALRFPVKNTKAVYFKAAQNFNSTEGTISFWLKLDPDQDLAPGFCDPLQVTDKAYNNSAIWVDFTKDDKPRHFRLGVFGALKAWNPNNLESDKNPAFSGRLAVVNKPPFTRDRWTHIAITYSGLGAATGTASLYLNGQIQGSSSPIKEIFDWDMANTTFRLGVNYVGLMDDLSTFRRPLTAKEVAELATGKW